MLGAAVHVSGTVTSLGTPLTIPDEGTANVDGDDSLPSNGTYFTTINAIASPAAVGQLNVTGKATLAGALIVQFMGPMATVGTAYTIMNYGSHTGTFASIDVQNLPAGLKLVPSYNNTSFVLTVAQA